MEGQVLDASSKELSRRYVEGEITLDEFGFLTEQHARQVALRLSEQPMASVA